MRIAFFDTKAYDKPSFERYGKEQGVSFTFFLGEAAFRFAAPISINAAKNKYFFMSFDVFC